MRVTVFAQSVTQRQPRGRAKPQLGCMIDSAVRTAVSARIRFMRQAPFLCCCLVRASLTTPANCTADGYACVPSRVCISAAGPRLDFRSAKSKHTIVGAHFDTRPLMPFAKSSDGASEVYMLVGALGSSMFLLRRKRKTDASSSAASHNPNGAHFSGLNAKGTKKFDDM